MFDSFEFSRGTLCISLRNQIIIAVMKRAIPFGEQVDISSDDSDVDDVKPDLDIDHVINTKFVIQQPLNEFSEDELIRTSQMYQEYMQKLPVPSHHGSVIPFTSWMGLAASLKRLYGQPLHYLTNIQMKQWDQVRIGTHDEDVPLDTIVHPCKAEATIWAIEEVNRCTCSHLYLAKLWQTNPRHHTFIDPIVPKLQTLSK
ncbi:unnamed protein product [Cuscuta epithymum]|uniref:Protein RDM1 n=1 Tax=Cuscuta epithymum TaxID=186058 RepID=A0AAV0CWS7_9ASTE|nr:unnamed protein product [Cuscuta epithymum]CAH9132971.1 unnamed protein product [Cuscuta epithymum]